MGWSQTLIYVPKSPKSKGRKDLRLELYWLTIIKPKRDLRLQAFLSIKILFYKHNQSLDTEELLTLIIGSKLLSSYIKLSFLEDLSK